MARERRESAGYTLEEFGVALANKVGRKKPFGTSSVNGVLWGRDYSASMIEAIAELLDLALPPMTAGEAEVQEWADLGARLHRLSPEEFERELDAVRDIVKALERFRSRI
jgi:hypothetical protein